MQERKNAKHCRDMRYPEIKKFNFYFICTSQKYIYIYIRLHMYGNLFDIRFERMSDYNEIRCEIYHNLIDVYKNLLETL